MFHKNHAAIHHAIRTEESLHILHVWPDALAAAGPAALGRARTLVAMNCSTDGAIFHEQSVHLNGPPLSAYLRMTFGDPLLWPPPVSSHPMHVFVVRSSMEHLSRCASLLNATFHEAASSVGKRPPASVCAATETHTESITASQIIFNNNSLAALRYGGAGLATCEAAAARIAADMFLAGVPPQRVEHARTIDRPRGLGDTAGAFLFPDGFLLDSGSVSASRVVWHALAHV